MALYPLASLKGRDACITASKPSGHEPVSQVEQLLHVDLPAHRCPPTTPWQVSPGYLSDPEFSSHEMSCEEQGGLGLDVIQAAGIYLTTLGVCLSFSPGFPLLIKVTALPGIHFLESVFPGYQQDLCLLSGL